MPNLDEFTAAYLEVVLWLHTDENGDESNGSETFDDFAPAALAEAVEECADFQKAYAGTWREGHLLSDAQAGHDFWLTRNGHGAGFWDRGIGAAGEALTRAAESAGSRVSYTGDDGAIHFG